MQKKMFTILLKNWNLILKNAWIFVHIEHSYWLCTNIFVIWNFINIKFYIFLIPKRFDTRKENGENVIEHTYIFMLTLILITEMFLYFSVRFMLFLKFY